MTPRELGISTDDPMKAMKDALREAMPPEERRYFDAFVRSLEDAPPRRVVVTKSEAAGKTEAQITMVGDKLRGE